MVTSTYDHLETFLQRSKFLFVHCRLKVYCRRPEESSNDMHWHDLVVETEAHFRHEASTKPLESVVDERGAGKKYGVLPRRRRTTVLENGQR